MKHPAQHVSALGRNEDWERSRFNSWLKHRAVYRRARRKGTLCLSQLFGHLFLLHQAPIVIFNDADLESAINGTAFASFVASGQTCVSGARIIVQEGIYHEFVAAFIEKVLGITKRIGDRTVLSLLTEDTR